MVNNRLTSVGCQLGKITEMNNCEAVSHDPSEIILICWFIMSVETVVLLNGFWNMWYFFLWFFDEYKVKKLF